MPAFGVVTEGIDTGLFVDDLVTLVLRYARGPGDFSVWESDGFGLPTFLFSTHGQILSATFPVGRPAHCNWGFTAVGDYTLVFEVTGELATSGLASVLAIYHFKVTEEPLCLEALPADVNSDSVVDEHDLEIVRENIGRSVPVWPADHDHD